MTTETIIDNEFITMWYHADTAILHHIFHKYMYGEALRAVLETGVEQLKKNGAYKWLSDDRSYAVLPKEDIEWGFTYWGPKAVAAGWRFWAIVMPESVIGKMSHGQLIDAYGKLGLLVKIFSDSDEGMTWLKKQRI